MARCQVMGILNATPDSFSDGGRVLEDLDAVVAAMIQAGADAFDVGGESTRPGHERVSVDAQLDRVLPVIASVRKQAPEAVISIDTQDAAVAQAALDAGADLINDVSALGDPDMARVALDHGCAVVLMRNEDLGLDVLSACSNEMRAVRARALRAGLAPEQIVLDPGLGFGARPGADPESNLALVDHFDQFAKGFPVLIGASRKRFIGALTGVEQADQRVLGSLAVAGLAYARGAAIVRVHDVAATVGYFRELERLRRA